MDLVKSQSTLVFTDPPDKGKALWGASLVLVVICRLCKK